jgi:hypothetical protein
MGLTAYDVFILDKLGTASGVRPNMATYNGGFPGANLNRLLSAREVPCGIAMLC